MLNSIIHKPAWSRFERDPWAPVHFNWNALTPSSVFGPQLDTADAIPSVAVDIEETETEYRVVADLPGVAKDSIEVTVHDDVLKIAVAASEEKQESPEGRVLRKERYAGSVARSFKLGKSVDSEKIEAAYKDGVLRITVPKNEQRVVKVIDVTEHAES